MIQDLERIFALIPERKQELIKCFDSLAVSVGNPDLFEQYRTEAQELLNSLDNSEAYKFFHHIYNNLVMERNCIYFYRHNKEYPIRFEEPKHLELQEKEISLEGRC